MMRGRSLRAGSRSTIVLLTLVVLLAALVILVGFVSARNPSEAPRDEPAQTVEMASVAAAPTPLQADSPWAEGHRLMRRGAYDEAAAYYSNIAVTQSDPQTVAEALLLQAQAYRAAANYDAAIKVLDYIRVNLAATDTLPDALFTLGEVRRAADDCRGALDAWLEYEAHVGQAGMGPYLALQRAACYGKLEEWSNEVSAAQAALNLENGGPRQAQIEAYERLAEGWLRQGQLQQALDAYNHNLDLAGTRAYRAEMLYTTAGLARSLGQTQLAADRYRSVVVDYTEQARASAALAALADMGLDGTVSLYQAGVIALNAGNYSKAKALFEQVDASSDDFAAASFNHAVALIRLGQEDAGVQELRGLAETEPDWAGSALLRAGRILESNGRYTEADAVYDRLLQLAPNSSSVPDALFREGLTHLLRDDSVGALGVWQGALASGRTFTPAQRAQLLFWQGKAIAQTQGVASAAARDAWTQAATASPDTYYGLRAQDLLDGRLNPVNDGTPRDPGVLASTSDESVELQTWLAASQLTADGLGQELGADPNVRRADHLLALGLHNEATWELEPVIKRFTDARDLARLGALGDWLLERDLVTETLPIGRVERDLAGGSLFRLPESLGKHSYPAGWGDIAIEEAASSRVDPMLLLGVIRQESSFNPTARSSASAMGLTQILPDTGRQIAQTLGTGSTFQTSDLYKPAVNLEMGAYYLAQQLARYNGRIFPALAAYNGGAGNVDEWLSSWGDDADVFVEQIPFSETNTYVKVVYENYRLYAHLYGG